MSSYDVASNIGQALHVVMQMTKLFFNIQMVFGLALAVGTDRYPLATSSNEFLNPRFLSQIPSYDGASTVQPAFLDTSCKASLNAHFLS
jgi:hypothetical protein